MKVAKVIEVIEKSEESWEDAAQQAMINTARSVQKIQSIFLQRYRPIVDDNDNTTYRVGARIYITFERE